MSLIGAKKREKDVVSAQIVRIKQSRFAAYKRRERERERTASPNHRPMCNVNA